MKKEILFAGVISLGINGCYPKATPEMADNPREGCEMVLRDHLRSIDHDPTDPHYREMAELQKDIRESIQQACEQHYEAAGDYPGLK